MIDFINTLDDQLFLYLNNLGLPKYDDFWLFMTETYSGLPVFLLLLMMCYKKIGLRQTLFILLCVALLITISDQLSNLFKNILVQRPRPCYQEHLAGQFRLVKDGCGGRHGFFSAHASNSFVIATFFFLIFAKRYLWVALTILTWAVLTSYSRVYLGVHYPLDIIVGAFVGWFVGRLIYRLVKRIYPNTFKFKK